MSWPRPSLGSLVDTIVPARDKPTELDGPIPWLRIEDFDGKYVHASATGQGVSQQTVERMKLRVFPRGTVVCTCSCDMGTTAVVENPVVTNQTFIGLLPRDERLSSDYLYWSLQAFRDELNAQATGAIQQYLSRDDFRQLRLPMPPLSEQRAIADYLDVETARIDALIAKKQQLIHLLEERVDSTVFAGVTGRLTSPEAELKPSGVAWIGEVPARYGVPTLGALYRSQLGKMLNADAAAGPDQAPYIKNTNVQWDAFEINDLPTMSFGAEDRARCQLRPGDLLVCEGGEVGRSAVWSADDSGIFFQKALHRVRPISKGNTRFLMYCLWAASKQDVFAVEGNQATIVHLTGEKLMEHRFPFPPFEEQSHVVDLIDESRHIMDTARRLVQHQIDLLAEHRRALITAAVTGEFTVPGAA